MPHNNSQWDHKTPLLVAAAAGDSLVQLLLDHGAAVHAITTALHNAVSEHQSIGVVQLLVNAGCPLFILHPETRTALHVAVARWLPRAIRVLLHAGCSLYAKNMQNESALSVVLSEGDFKTLQQFIRSGSRELAEFDEERSDSLVCIALQRMTVWASYHPKKRAFKRAANLLIRHGATLHSDCCICHTWLEKRGIRASLGRDGDHRQTVSLNHETGYGQ
ncbi:ankyrin repeat domain-containing protein [Aspergillus undulatus]|uniref:ankyrin repeat domain-containing protein n=1 Tax=Aspergillus undulatus TaxID=1810928 RepID=UPI003CCDBB10